MDLVELIFYQKMQGVKRCPHGDADAALEMDELFERFLIFGSAADVTEQEE